MITASRPLETLQRNCAIGIRFWDSAFGPEAGGGESDGLIVELHPRADPMARRRLQVNRSGVYVCHAVPLLRDWEFTHAPAESLWSRTLRTYRIEVFDPRRRFVDMAFDADLPVRGYLNWLAPWVSPPQPLVLPVWSAAASPPTPLLMQLPLFSAPGRPVPDPLAAVHAQLRHGAGGPLAAGALLAVHVEGRMRGLGLADGQGRVAVYFPYPEPPRHQRSSPPEARRDFSWPLTFEAFYAAPPSPPPQPRPGSRLIDLGAALQQLAQPRIVITSLLSPAGSPAGALRLNYRAPVTARTEGAAAQDASFLLIA